MSPPSFAQAIDLDAYLGQADYYFEGELKGSSSALIEKEDVSVVPLNETMTRYIFRTQNIPSRPEIAFFTFYKNSEGQLFAYLQDLAYLQSAANSFLNLTELNPNRWVEANESGDQLDVIFYPGDLGERHFTFEFKANSIVITLREWELWFAMVPVPKTSTFEFKFNR
jgi:hypothetical protein